MKRHPPVEPVAAHIDETAAPLLVVKQGLHHSRGGVLGMRRRHDTGVGFEKSHAFSVEVVVGDDIEGNPQFLEPVGDVGVGVVLPDVVAWPHAQEGSETRGIGNTGAVAVVVIHRQSVLRVHVKVDIGHVDLAELVAGVLARVTPTDLHVVVDVGVVAAGGNQQGQAGPRTTRRGTDIEGDVEPLIVLGQEGGKRAAPAIGRHLPGGIRFPGAVIEIVVVEVDGAIVFRPMGPYHLAAVVIPALHGSRGHVDDCAVKPVWREVVGRHAIHFAAEVPQGHHIGRDVGRNALIQKVFHLAAFNRSSCDRRRIDLAVEETADTVVGVVAGNDESAAVSRSNAHGPCHPCTVGVAGIAHERFLDEGGLACCGIECRGHEVPVAFVHADGRDQRFNPAAITDRQGEPPVDDAERISPVATGIPGAHDGLFFLLEECRPDHRLEREALQIQFSGMIDRDEGTNLGFLEAGRVVAVDPGLDRRLLETRSTRRVVTATNVKDVEVEGALILTGDLEVDGLARLDADPVGISEKPSHALSSSQSMVQGRAASVANRRNTLPVIRATLLS